MDLQQQHKLRNSMTEHNKRYKYVNMYLSLCYSCLPGVLSKLSNILFVLTLKDIKYVTGTKGQIETGQDRIFTSTPITIYYILENAKSLDYAKGKKMGNDSSNWKKYIQELHKNNIYYFWQYRDFYIFIMEREFALWLIYNKEGFVIPKTMKKIVVRAKDMIASMAGYVKESGKSMDIQDIENSFGRFINEMINKMNHLIALESLPRWTTGMNMGDFIDDFLQKVDSLEEFDGLIESEEFLNRLPVWVSEKYKRLIKEEEKMIAKAAKAAAKAAAKELAKDLVPKGKNANLAKKPRGPRKKKIITPEVGAQPKKAAKVTHEGPLNPFLDAQQFVKYYRAFLQQCSGSTSIRFDNFASDGRVAGVILDLLHDYNRKDRQFLDRWLEYFFTHSLKGNKMYQVKNTSMSVFRYSFEKFNETFYIPQ